MQYSITFSAIEPISRSPRPVVPADHSSGPYKQNRKASNNNSKTMTTDHLKMNVNMNEVPSIMKSAAGQTTMTDVEVVHSTNCCALFRAFKN